MIKINTRGVSELTQFFKDLPYGTKKYGIEAATKYLIGDIGAPGPGRHGLKYYPERIEHGESNPYQWQSDKQRRAFFATKGFGRGIPSVRTNQLKEGWDYRTTGGGYQTTIYNKYEYADFVQGDRIQRGHVADKWRQFGAIISTNINGAIQAAEQAVQKWIDEHGGR